MVMHWMHVFMSLCNCHENLPNLCSIYLMNIIIEMKTLNNVFCIDSFQRTVVADHNFGY